MNSKHPASLKVQDRFTFLDLALDRVIKHDLNLANGKNKLGMLSMSLLYDVSHILYNLFSFSFVDRM